jgi:aspartate dehydrogenase
MSETTIGLIGFGAIGREVATLLAANAAGSPAIVALNRSTPSDARGLRFVRDTAELIATKPALVIEAAGHAAVSQHVVAVLKAGIPVLLASVGALADTDLCKRVEVAAAEGNTELILPGGAVGGLDYLRAVAGSANLKVRYCSRKPIGAWAKELTERGHALDKIDGEIVLFEGSAREAALSFPQNLNVAMALALAGPGVDGIAVRVVADSAAEGNTHEISIESSVGRACLVFENNPSPTNPKTSALTALSIIQTVRERLRLGPHRQHKFRLGVT